MSSESDVEVIDEQNYHQEDNKDNEGHGYKDRYAIVTFAAFDEDDGYIQQDTLIDMLVELNDILYKWISYRVYEPKLSAKEARKNNKEQMSFYAQNDQQGLEIKDLTNPKAQMIFICKLAYVNQTRAAAVKEQFEKLGFPQNIKVFVGKAGSKYKTITKIEEKIPGFTSQVFKDRFLGREEKHRNTKTLKQKQLENFEQSAQQVVEAFDQHKDKKIGFKDVREIKARSDFILSIDHQTKEQLIEMQSKGLIKAKEAFDEIKALHAMKLLRYEQDVKDKTIDHIQMIYLEGPTGTYKTEGVYAVFKDIMGFGIYEKLNGLKDNRFENFEPWNQSVLFIDEVACTESDEIQLELLKFANHRPFKVSGRYQVAHFCLFDYIVFASNKTFKETFSTKAWSKKTLSALSRRCIKRKTQETNEAGQTWKLKDTMKLLQSAGIESKRRGSQQKKIFDEEKAKALAEFDKETFLDGNISEFPQTDCDQLSEWSSDC